MSQLLKKIYTVRPKDLQRNKRMYDEYYYNIQDYSGL
ncbi:hypothetical protein Nit79A3_2256 [Nitrosomonas sp. Is79A3]